MTQVTTKKSLACDTCGRETDRLRRDVVDAGYNALTKPPLWNCEDCYSEKRRKRQGQDGPG